MTEIELLMNENDRLTERVEMLQRFLARDGRRHKVTEGTLRKRGGDAAIAEAKAEAIRMELVFERSPEPMAGMQSKIARQAKEIRRLRTALIDKEAIADQVIPDER